VLCCDFIWIGPNLFHQSH